MYVWKKVERRGKKGKGKRAFFGKEEEEEEVRESSKGKMQKGGCKRNNYCETTTTEVMQVLFQRTYNTVCVCIQRMTWTTVDRELHQK